VDLFVEETVNINGIEDLATSKDTAEVPGHSFRKTGHLMWCDVSGSKHKLRQQQLALNYFVSNPSK
jgi:hypothetical protein